MCSFHLYVRQTDDIFALMIMYSPWSAYPLHVVDIILYKTHFHTFRQVYECKLWVDNLKNTEMLIIVSGNFGVIWRISVKATPLLGHIYHRIYNNIQQ